MAFGTSLAKRQINTAPAQRQAGKYPRKEQPLLSVACLPKGVMNSLLFANASCPEGTLEL